MTAKNPKTGRRRTDATRRRAAELLATGMTKTAIATKLGIDRRTLNRWLSAGDKVVAEHAAKVEAAVEAGAIKSVADLRGRALKTAKRLMKKGVDPRVQAQITLGILRFTETPQKQQVEVSIKDPRAELEKLLGSDRSDASDPDEPDGEPGG